MGATAAKFSDEEILTALDAADAPVLTAVEIAESFGVSRAAANARLKGLQDDGKVERKTVGSRAVVWWRS